MNKCIGILQNQSNRLNIQSMNNNTEEINFKEISKF